jgi:hypothetical protein
MTSIPSRWASRILAMLLQFALVCSSLPAQQADYTFRVQSELVLVNVTVRDKNGNFVRGLKPSRTSRFSRTTSRRKLSPSMWRTSTLWRRRMWLRRSRFRARCLSPQPGGRSASAAAAQTNPVQRSPPHRSVLRSLGHGAGRNRSRDSFRRALCRYADGSGGSGLDCFSGKRAAGEPGFHRRSCDLLKKQFRLSAPAAARVSKKARRVRPKARLTMGQPFTADDTEYNIFNTDRRLEALRSVAEKLSHLDQKKSLIYFSSGMDRTGIENQSELRAATNAAVRANLAIYTMDLRGLQALVAGGEAQNASLRGTSAYSGQATINSLNSNFTTQETLVTLASDTGGRAFLDSNDFGQVFKGVQQDTSTYYLVGYRSTNPARDGRYRRITVKVNVPGVKVDYRRGYYAPADYQHSTKEDKELQLQQELASELPTTDLASLSGAAYFRMEANKFYIPISLVVPGSEIPFTRSSDRDKATLDVIGVVTDSENHPVTQIRDTVKLAVDTSSEVQKKNVQYDTGLSLPPGKFHLKFVVRENQTGRMGSFETDLDVPDLKSQPLKMSSIVLASQLQPAKKGASPNPLIRDGSEIIPNVTHVFSSGQHLRLYYEVYDPGIAKPSLLRKRRPKPAFTCSRMSHSFAAKPKCSKLAG